MAYFLFVAAIALHIVKVNDWFAVPTFCIVFCYIFGLICSMIKYAAKNIAKEICKRIEENEKNI